MITGIIVVVLMVWTGMACWFVGGKIEHDYWVEIVGKLQNKIRRLRKWTKQD
jgi:uncharacterized protein YdgA (DUF945 family)